MRALGLLLLAAVSIAAAAKQEMYFGLLQFEVKDPAAMPEYVRRCNSSMMSFGGKMLAANPNFGRDGAAANRTIENVEGWWMPQYFEVHSYPLCVKLTEMFQDALRDHDGTQPTGVMRRSRCGKTPLTFIAGITRASTSLQKRSGTSAMTIPSYRPSPL